MSKFYKGQTVVAVKSRNSDKGPVYLAVGSKYIVNDTRSWRCGCRTRYLVDVGIREGHQVEHACLICNKNTFFDDVTWLDELCFVPLAEETFEAVNSATLQVPVSAN